jgi:hypothetical protein
VKYLDKIVITLRNKQNNLLPIYINVENNSLSKKWLESLNHLLVNDYHLEKNYCFLGFDQSDRTPEYICDQINLSIAAINQQQLGYRINDHFTVKNTINDDDSLNHNRMNNLHRYFEDLQGVSGAMSQHYNNATAETRWHIRQLNLLCHEYESLVLSIRKAKTAPEWRRPSQLMCWLNAPRFMLDEQDYKLFGVETINRKIGGVYVGVNKAVGKHHWEVFCDEGRDSRINELTTSTLKNQTEAAGDFDIEWANDPGAYPWQQKELAEFREWLITNGFDPEDKSLTIGHPQVAQVDLLKSFGTTDYEAIWRQLNNYQDVYRVTTGAASAVYPYRWRDADFQQRQIKIISQGH